MKVVLYDGVCNLCDGTVQFLLEKDREAKLSFASLQSPYAQAILKEKGVTVTSPPESIFFWDEGQLYGKSEAAFRILKNLPAPWSWLSALSNVPGPIRDSVYGLIAKNRYRWFGKEDQCLLPKPEWKSRFLG